MNANATQATLPLTYFVFVFVLSIPIWLIGGNRLPLPMNLPVSALMFFAPLFAASLLSYRRYGVHGIKELLTKAVDYQTIHNKRGTRPCCY